jgi:hypothetical protein
MRSDLLQQLRDIHVPAPPGWWPPAPGWWFLASLALAALLLLARIAWRAWARRRPIRRARDLHAALAGELRDGTITGAAYTHACNELLKRLFVHGLGIDAARRVADDRWLAMLDRALGAPEFTRGAGQILGDARFARDPEIDAAALARLVERLLAAIAPRTAERLRLQPDYEPHELTPRQAAGFAADALEQATPERRA